MEVIFDIETLLTGLIIFAARIVDVSVGTIRLLAIVSGRTFLAFFLGFIEVSLWLVIIAKVLNEISDKPLLGLFFALGFSAGNAVGILLDKKIALGHLVLKIFVRNEGKEIADKIRQTGFSVTTFDGEGEHGAITELNIVCRKRELKKVVQIVKFLDPEAFYITEPVLSVSRKLTNLFNPLYKINKHHNSETNNEIGHLLNPIAETVR
ncbi:MAG: DUF2179 domain-containing protein [Candidatus Brocadiales bacterium]|nr:DUF2179 domain-containing protein [Candidatus Brocadiales bacterium]